jgi:hypothetical protein
VETIWLTKTFLIIHCRLAELTVSTFKIIPACPFCTGVEKNRLSKSKIMANNKFQTKVEIPQFPKKTGYTMKNLFMGSCFTENVGSKMEALKFPADINPFGILYNPASVASGLQILLQNKKIQKDDLIEYNGLWHSFSHHGRFSSVSVEETLQKINDRIGYSLQNF